MRQSQEDLMWQAAAARQEKQEQRYRDEIEALRQRAEAAEAALAAAPVGATTQNVISCSFGKHMASSMQLC